MDKEPHKYKDLKAKIREIREELPESPKTENFNIRIHRALSWLKCAEQYTDDQDAAIIFYWISFNALYGDINSKLEWDEHKGERSVFEEYFKKILTLGGNDAIYNVVWNKFPGPIRSLLNNKYVFPPFWKGHKDWKDSFKKSKRRIGYALAKKNKRNTRVILSILFDRLYVLRNQLMHGEATWQGTKNRDQIRDGYQILRFLVPLFIHITLENPKDIDLGDLRYPVVNE